MTSTMAATNCVRLHNIIVGDLSNSNPNQKNIAISFKRRRFSTIIASGGNQKKKSNVETINGKKVNGIHSGENVLSPSLKNVNVDTPLNAYLLGKFADQERFVYRQTFIIRSYETGPDKTATMETLMNLLQVRQRSYSLSFNKFPYGH